MTEIPKLQKKISSFLTRDEGKISKEKLLKTGILVGAIALASVNSVEATCPVTTTGTHDDHCNQLTLDATASTATGTHGHDYHSNHSSHGSHSSGGWC